MKQNDCLGTYGSESITEHCQRNICLHYLISYSIDKFSNLLNFSMCSPFILTVTRFTNKAEQFVYNVRFKMVQ